EGARHVVDADDQHRVAVQGDASDRHELHAWLGEGVPYEQVVGSQLAPPSRLHRWIAVLGASRAPSTPTTQSASWSTSTTQISTRPRVPARSIVIGHWHSADVVWIV